MNTYLSKKQWNEIFETAKKRSVSLLKINKLLYKRRANIGHNVVIGTVSTKQALRDISRLDKIQHISQSPSTPPEKIDELALLLK